MPMARRAVPHLMTRTRTEPAMGADTTGMGADITGTGGDTIGTEADTTGTNPGVGPGPGRPSRAVPMRPSDVVARATRYLERHGVESPRTSAEILLMEVLGADRAAIYARSS